jgi:hypothetical protein
MRLPRTARRSGLAAAALTTALLLPTPAIAGTVTSLADDGGAGTLRSQVAAADPGELIVFQAGLTGTILLNSELLIQKNLTIGGPGARQLRISGGDTTRVLRVSEETAVVEVKGVTIEHGLAGDMLPFGGGLLVEAATRVRLERVSLVDNVADSGAGFPGFGAGAFVRDGELELIDSTVAGNRVLDDNGGGGGLFIAEVGTTFEIVRSTIADNQADLGAGVTAAGADGTIEDTTIARNVAELGGGIATSPTVANVDIARSLVTANEAATGPACNGLVTSLGLNVVDAVTGCDFTAATGDTTGVAAPVGALGGHGGPTDTLMPLLGNPALDHVPAPCPGDDQRGEDRPRGPGCDAGAVEALPATLTSAGPLALGAALVGQQTAPASTLVTNTGEVAAVVTGVTKSGPNEAEVVGVPAADECTATTVLEPGAACRVQARLAPTSVGAKQATYVVALAGSVVEVPVTGSGARPATLEASGPMALGSAQVGQRSAPVVVEITNTGDLDAAITDVSLGGPHAAEVERVADPDECTTTTVLGAGMSCKLKARLAPASVGAKQATYTVSLAGSSVDVAVTGTGDPAPQPPVDPGAGGGSTNANTNPPQPSSAAAIVVGTRTKAGKGGKLKLRLRCATVNAGSCVGSLTLKLGARKLTKRFAIAAGKELVVTLKLGAGDRRKLARKRSLKSAVTVVTTQPDGTRKTTHQSSFKLLRA